MATAIPIACLLSFIRPPGFSLDVAHLEIAPISKSKCPLVASVKDVNFRLYTDHNPIEYQNLVIGDDTLLSASYIDFKKDTVIYFHAFMESPDDGSGLNVRQALLLRGGFNVIMLDAYKLEAGPWYITAADNTWYIGKFAAIFIDYLVSRGLDLRKTQLIGHSLGAHAAGVAGASIKSGRVARITGLDPACPLFTKVDDVQRLDPSDAEFVDVIHTDAGILGFTTPVGHVDFYPNGGISPQPGCELEVVTRQQMLFNKVFCSHWRSFRYYAESILRPDAFVANSCASWKKYKQGGCNRTQEEHMGYGVDHNARGVYYLRTRRDSPFSLE